MCWINFYELIFPPNNTNVVICVDNRIGFVVSGLICAPHRPQAGKWIPHGSYRNLNTIHISLNKLKIVQGILGI